MLLGAAPEVVALFEKMEALFSFMSGAGNSSTFGMKKREEDLDLPVLWLS